MVESLQLVKLREMFWGTAILEVAVVLVLLSIAAVLPVCQLSRSLNVVPKKNVIEVDVNVNEVAAVVVATLLEERNRKRDPEVRVKRWSMDEPKLGNLQKKNRRSIRLVNLLPVLHLLDLAEVVAAAAAAAAAAAVAAVVAAAAAVAVAAIAIAAAIKVPELVTM